MRTIAAAMVLLMASAAGASANTGGEFLRLGAGARPAGMGGAGASLIDDATALYWNPALLSLLERPDAAFSHAEHFRTARYETLHAAAPSVRLGGTVGAGLTYLRHDSVQRVTASGADRGSFTPSSMALSLGYGSVLRLEHARVGVGASSKMIRETLDDVSATAFAGDIGVWADFDRDTRWFARGPRWRAAASLRNIGTRERFLRESSALPTELAIAVSHLRDEDAGLTSTVETVFPYDAGLGVKLGAEWAAPVTQGVTGFLRAGFDTVAAQNRGVVTGLTLGGGARIGLTTWDMAYQNGGELGHTFKLSAHCRFGKDWSKR